ncbi:MAG: endolytic transglycosylase MltG [Candidatus Dojkabacteria bacterium]
MKKVLILLLILIAIGAVGVFAANSWYQNAIGTPLGDSEEIVVFEVKAGDSTDDVADNLVSAGLIADRLPFVIYMRLNSSLADGIQAGLFDLAPNMNIKVIATELQQSRRAEELKVTIPEGLRYDEIADIMRDEFKGVPNTTFKRNEFIDIAKNPDNYTFTDEVQSFLNEHKPAGESLEGFLLPETYFMYFDTSAKEVVERMIETMITPLTDEDLAAISTSGYNFYEILNVASMIEREAFTDSEKPQIADVIYKRLEQGVDGVKLLQIDATLLYGARDWEADAFALKQVDGPYNTYLRAGLPPTPIANPGITAIRAALFPEANEYFYYIHDLTGRVYFAKNLAEHEANIRNHLN